MATDLSKAGWERETPVVTGEEYIEPPTKKSRKDGVVPPDCEGDTDADGRAPMTEEELKRWRSDDEVLRLAGAMSPNSMLMLARLRLLARFGSRKVPTQVRAAIVVASGAKRSWVKAVVKDVAWWIANTQQGGSTGRDLNG